MKKILAMLLALVMVLSLAACNVEKTPAETQPKETQPQAGNNDPVETRIQVTKARHTPPCGRLWQTLHATLFAEHSSQGTKRNKIHAAPTTSACLVCLLQRLLDPI